MELLIFFLKAFSIIMTIIIGFGIGWVIADLPKNKPTIKLTVRTGLELAFYITSIYVWFI